MDISKAIKKQNNSLWNFLIFMSFVFFILPVTLYESNKSNIFFLMFLGILEVLVILVVVTRLHQELLIFSYQKYKLKLKMGLFSEYTTIFCDKVVVVHTEVVHNDFEIVILTSSRFHGRKLKLVDLSFIERYKALSEHCLKVKSLGKEEYYYIIKKGGYTKYELLFTIYTSCVSATFTNEAIERIKSYKSFKGNKLK
ncbi:MAG TPA: hypothetical protein VIK72_08790 [Clostridiaceae bacterium]